ncbi:uncharacterized protein LOC129989093 [Argiope bruennichi]|uniref:Activating transcription factor of chaperone like protein n=1 Tax=Argiope bruennichi TaxID=94029 RepID=A0A8T0ED45_ARGBR|nr:uncharacterized protein LOC129989093 [Argiope bruennichi]KAF8770679.1 Activating transcription factor of chaperone like protein [Argiope bruennichi]
MCFLRSPLLTGWSESNKMIEYEPLIWEGWQEDATLFPATEPNGILNFDELLGGKINNDLPLEAADCNDLNWLDEKVDLSTILQTPPTEEEYRLIDDAVNLLFDSSNIDSYLSSDLAKNESDIYDTSINSTQDQAASSNDFSFTAPSYEAISEAGSPAPSFADKSEYLTSTGICLSPPGQVVPAEICQSPSYSSTPRERSPSRDFSQSPSEISNCSTPGGQSTSDDLCQSPPDFSCFLGSPESSDVYSPAPSELTSSSVSEEATAESSVSVMVCDISPETILSDSEDLSIEEVTRSVRKRKFVNNGKEIPKIRVSLDNVFHPYKKTEGGRPRNKNDRKKVQNKEAAARYRMKKKLEQREIMDEVSTLESEQKDLQKKHDSLVSEIKYLKSLMCEILQKKGVLK